MGWRGTMRSIGAAQRRHQKSTTNTLKALERESNKVGRLIGKVDSEVERDLAQVAAIERRIMESPIHVAKLAYDRTTGRWTFPKMEDHSGQLTWSMQQSCTTDIDRFTGTVENGKRRFTPLALTVTRWGVFLAVEIGPGPGGKTRKLFNRTDPSKNLVAIRYGENLAVALEGDLDRDPGFAPIGLIAFSLPTPAQPVQPCRIEFCVGTGDPVFIPVEHGDLAGLIQKVAASPSLVDTVRAEFAKKVAPMQQQARQAQQDISVAAERAKSGCLVFFVLLAGAVSAVAAVTTW